MKSVELYAAERKISKKAAAEVVSFIIINRTEKRCLPGGGGGGRPKRLSRYVNLADDAY